MAETVAGGIVASGAAEDLAQARAAMRMAREMPDHTKRWLLAWLALVDPALFDRARLAYGAAHPDEQ